MFNNNNGNYDNSNKGAIFVNDKKQKTSHPDYSGKINVNGVDYYISGWQKQGKNGSSFLSLSVKPVDQPNRPQNQKYQPQQQGGNTSFGSQQGNQSYGSQQQQHDPFANGGDAIPFN